MDRKLKMAYETIKRLEGKLSDARDAIIFAPEPPWLTPDGSGVTLSKDVYNKIIECINP